MVLAGLTLGLVLKLITIDKGLFNIFIQTRTALIWNVLQAIALLKIYS